MEILIYTYTFFFGAILGSFFNVVILRLPKGESLSKESSHCPQCHTKIKAYDLIPILSYFILRGKCRHCSTKISFRYPLVELLTAFSYLLVVMNYGLSVKAIIGVVFISILIIIAFMDIDTLEIMDRFQVMIAILAMINLIFTDKSFYNHVIAFFMISVPFLLIAHFSGGMGGGDIKLIAVGGLLLGIQPTLIAFFIASITGGIVAVYLLITKQKERSSMIAFGPYLCIGLAIAYLYGDFLFASYLALF